MSQKPPCSFFQKGNCRKGDQCNFSHSGGGGQQQQQQSFTARGLGGAQSQSNFGAAAPAFGQAVGNTGNTGNSNFGFQGKPRVQSSTNPLPGAGKPSQPCRNGINCTRGNCYFQHPPGWQGSGGQGLVGQQSLPQIGGGALSSMQSMAPSTFHTPNQGGGFQQQQSVRAASAAAGGSQTCAAMTRPPMGNCPQGRNCPDRHNFAITGVTNLFLNYPQNGHQLKVLVCKELNKEFYVCTQSAQGHTSIGRIDAVTGQLKDQIKHLPQNYEVHDFIPLGQRGMILVVSANNIIFFSHTESIQSMAQVHQGKLLGYYQDEQQGLIYSIGHNEPVIKQMKVENNLIVPVGQITAPAQMMPMVCAVKLNMNMLIGIGQNNYVLNINLANGSANPQMSQINFSGFGKQNSLRLDHITKMEVSSDGQYLAVLDSKNIAVVFKAQQQLNNQKPAAYHEFKNAPPTCFTVISGADKGDNFALIAGSLDGTINYVLYSTNQDGSVGFKRGKIAPNQEWQAGHPDISKQAIVSICDLRHCAPNGEHVFTTTDQAGEVKIWQLNF